MKQLALLKNQPSAYGGELLKTRKGRARPRPLDTRHTMHLVLRSSQANGPWSFRKPENARKVREISLKFSRKYGVRILSLANVGNHLHFHIKLSNRFTYQPFIRALTAAIAMGITGASRWRPMVKPESGAGPKRGASATKRGLGAARPVIGAARRENGAARREDGATRREPSIHAKARFWDYRPFTRVVKGLRAFLTLKDYLRINQYEGYGYRRDEARFLVFWEQGGVKWAEDTG